jgi:hypothetical protein
MVTIEQNGIKLYGLRVTRPQIEKVAVLNERFNENLTIGDGCDFVEVADDAEMIGGKWGSLTIGILADGSSHS